MSRVPECAKLGTPTVRKATEFTSHHYCDAQDDGNSATESHQALGCRLQSYMTGAGPYWYEISDGWGLTFCQVCLAVSMCGLSSSKKFFQPQ